MKLAEALSQIRSGDVLLFRRSTSLFGRLIRLRTESPYSHAGIAVQLQVGPFQQLFVAEALEGVGVRLFPLPRYVRQCHAEGCLIDWFKIISPEVAGEWAAAYAVDQVGKRYASSWQFVWSWGWASSWWRRLTGRPADTDPERFFCSELVAGALEYAGYVPDDDLPQEAAETAPGAIALFPCLQRKGAIE